MSEDGDIFKKLADLQIGLMAAFGHVVLVLVGIAMACYAIIRRYSGMPVGPYEVSLLVCGIALASSSMVRQLVCFFVIFLVPWAALIGGAYYLYDSRSLEVLRPDVTVIAVLAIPPLLCAIVATIKRNVQPPEPAPEDA